MAGRLRSWLHCLFIATSQWVRVWVVFWPYVLWNHPKPSPDETLSSYVGRMAIRRKPWAMRTEWMIDHTLSFLFKTRPRHCFRAIGT